MDLYESWNGTLVKGGRAEAVQDLVCREDTYRLFLNDSLLAQLIASPSQLRELGAGFIVCEGLSQSVTEVRVADNNIYVTAPVKMSIDYELRSSACIGVRGAPRVVTSDLTVEMRDIGWAIGEIVSEVWQRTGGAHCSVLLCDGKVLVRSSDIGRHCTVDKVVGHAILAGINLSRCVLGCTGRQPMGMIAKAANAGIPVVISKAAATTSGIMLADMCGVTLVCFARGDRFTVYSHAERIRGLPSVSEGP